MYMYCIYISDAHEASGATCGLALLFSSFEWLKCRQLRARHLIGNMEKRHVVGNSWCRWKFTLLYIFIAQPMSHVGFSATLEIRPKEKHPLLSNHRPTSLQLVSIANLLGSQTPGWSESGSPCAFPSALDWAIWQRRKDYDSLSPAAASASFQLHVEHHRRATQSKSGCNRCNDPRSHPLHLLHWLM